MIFITGPLYSGKRTFAKTLPGRCICDVQELAAGAENLEKLADELSAYDIVLATEVGGGVVPMVIFFPAQYRPRYSGILVRQRHRRDIPVSSFRQCLQPLAASVRFILTRIQHRTGAMD